MKKIIAVILLINLFSLACSMSLDLGNSPGLPTPTGVISSGQTTSNGSNSTANNSNSTQSTNSTSSDSSTSTQSTNNTDTSTQSTSSESSSTQSTSTEATTTSSDSGATTSNSTQSSSAEATTTSSDSSSSTQSTTTEATAEVNSSSSESESSDESSSSTEDEVGQVSAVVSGNNIVVVANGQTYNVNYMNVDIPAAQQTAALEANRRMVEGQTVRMERGAVNRDPSGNLLRYVYLADGRMVNEELLGQGVGQVSGSPMDTKHLGRLQQRQNLAKSQGLGLWQPQPNAQPAPGGPAAQPAPGQPAAQPGAKPGGVAQPAPGAPAPGPGRP